MAQPAENVPPLLAGADRGGNPRAARVFPTALRQLQPILALLLLTAALLTARVTERIDLPIFRCTFKQVTGLPCAFCGGTRSFRALTHFDVSNALRWNPLAVLAALTVLVGALLHLILPKTTITRWRESLQRLPWIKFAIGLAALNWIYLILFLPR